MRDLINKSFQICGLVLLTGTLVLTACDLDHRKAIRDNKDSLRRDIAQRWPQCAGLPFEGGYSGDAGLLLQCAIYYELVLLNNSIKEKQEI